MRKQVIFALVLVVMASSPVFALDLNSVMNNLFKNDVAGYTAVSLNSAATIDSKYGSGTPNYIAKYITNNYLGNSAIYEKNGKVGIGVTNPGADLEIYKNQSGITLLRVRNDVYNSYSLVEAWNGPYTVAMIQAGSGVAYNGAIGPYVSSIGGNSPVALWVYSIRGDIVLSPGGDNNEVMRLSGGNTSLGGNNQPNVVHIKGTLSVSNLSGSGSAYACIDANGQFYRSLVACR